MSLPAVSVYCSTFGRPHTLVEVIESFRRQDYQGEMEMVVFNDCTRQQLLLDKPDPRIRIINYPFRVKPLGAKFNRNIDLCLNDILVCFEDDDIYLPGHISHAVANMRDGVFHTGNAWVEEGEGRFHFSGNIFHATHVFERDLYEKAGKYPEVDNTTVDIRFMERMRSVVGNYSQPSEPSNLHYIYRWQTARCWHASGWGSGINNVSDLAGEVVHRQFETGDLTEGQVILTPAWKYDYSQYLPRESR